MSVVDPSDLLPLRAVAVKEQALALIINSGKQWTIKDISQAINCNHEHARRTLQSLLSQRQIARRKLPSTGGRPLYAYTEKDFSYTPPPPPPASGPPARRRGGGGGGRHEGGWAE